MKDETLYHIYIKNDCVYPCLNEEEFKIKWTEVNAMVGLMHTDYELSDLSYEKLPGNTGSGGGGSFDDNLEPSY